LPEQLRSHRFVTETEGALTWGSPISAGSGGGAGGFNSDGPTASKIAPAATTATALAAERHRIRTPPMHL
jgi:hypothetical protein